MRCYGRRLHGFAPVCVHRCVMLITPDVLFPIDFRLYGLRFVFRAGVCEQRLRGLADGRVEGVLRLERLRGVPACHKAGG